MPSALSHGASTSFPAIVIIPHIHSIITIIIQIHAQAPVSIVQPTAESPALFNNGCCAPTSLDVQQHHKQEERTQNNMGGPKNPHIYVVNMSQRPMLPNPEPNIPVIGMDCNMIAGIHGLPSLSQPAISSYFQQFLTSHESVVLFHVKQLLLLPGSHLDHGMLLADTLEITINIKMNFMRPGFLVHILG